MYYVFFITVNMIYGLYEYVTCMINSSKSAHFQLKYSQDRYYDRIVKSFSRWLFDFHHEIEFENKKEIEYNDIILLSVCHQNYLDFIVLNEFLTIQYPAYRPIFVMSEFSIRLFPFLKNFLKQGHVIVHKGYHFHIDEIKMKLFTMGYPTKKIIMVVFPEGKLFTKYNLEKSINYSYSQSNSSDETPPQTFEFVLRPYEKAYNELYNMVRQISPNSFTSHGLVLFYPECPKKSFRFCNFYDFIFPPYSITTVHWTLLPTKDRTVYSIFQKIENVLMDKNKTPTHFSSIQEPLLWTTSKLLYINLPICYVCYGFFDTCLLLILLFTSYQWHYYHQQYWKVMDNFITVLCWLRFFSKYTKFSSKFMMIMGVLSHLVFERYSTNKKCQDYGHLLLHIFCYTSIFAEISVL